MAIASDLLTTLNRIRAGATADGLETRRLDFKADGPDTSKAIIETSVCFANALGGIIVAGVRNKPGGPDAFTGCELNPEDIRGSVFRNTQPPLIVDARAETYDGKRLLIIEVPESPDIHADSQGRAFRRVDRQECKPMTHLEQMRLREERAGFDWSAQRSKRPVSDVPPLALEVARERLRVLTDERQELAKQGDTDLLRSLGVVNAAGDLLNAGEVLFCSPDPGTPPLILYQYRPTAGGEATSTERLSRPLVTAFQRALELVEARRNITPITLPDGQQLALADFPDLAVREAIANGVIHRDYRLTSPVMIDHSGGSLVIQSPGLLVAGVTPDNILTHPSKPRNDVLAAAFRVLGLAEETGRGVDRMYREMIRSGRDVPTISETEDGVRVALLGGQPNTRIARFVAQLPEDERNDTDTLLVILALCTRRTVQAPTLAPRLQKDPAEVEEVLRRLSAEPVSVIEPTRGTLRKTHPAYRLRGEALQALGPAARYQRRTTDEIDRKVIAHILEFNRISNKTIRNLFDVDVQQAKAIAADLVEREIIVKTSAAQRGPTVEYGPGPKFPWSRSRKRAGRRIN